MQLPGRWAGASPAPTISPTGSHSLMHDNRPGSSHPLFAPALPLRIVVLTAFALRLFQLGTQSLWYDESVSLFIARQPIPELIAHTAGDVHPPLYYLLLHFWLQVAGTTEF